MKDDHIKSCQKMQDKLKKLKLDDKIPTPNIQKNHPWIFDPTIDTTKVDIFNPEIFETHQQNFNLNKVKKVEVTVLDITANKKVNKNSNDKSNNERVIENKNSKNKFSKNKKPYIVITTKSADENKRDSSLRKDKNKVEIINIKDKIDAKFKINDNKSDNCESLKICINKKSNDKINKNKFIRVYENDKAMQSHKNCNENKVIKHDIVEIQIVEENKDLNEIKKTFKNISIKNNMNENKIITSSINESKKLPSRENVKNSKNNQNKTCNSSDNKTSSDSKNITIKDSAKNMKFKESKFEKNKYINEFKNNGIITSSSNENFKRTQTKKNSKFDENKDFNKAKYRKHGKYSDIKNIKDYKINKHTKSENKDKNEIKKINSKLAEMRKNKRFKRTDTHKISKLYREKYSKINKDINFTFSPHLQLEIVKDNQKYHLGYVKQNQYTKNIYIIPNDKNLKIFKVNKKNLNRALDGDSVYFEIINKGSNRFSNRRNSNTDEIKKTAKVVAIESRRKKMHKFIGQLNFDPNLQLYKMNTGRSMCTFAYINSEDPNISKEKDIIYVAEFREWPEHLRYPLAKILFKYQRSDNEIDQESHYILINNELIDFLVYDNDRKRVEPSTDLPIDGSRLDLTKECVFTIDPATACDLDDAISFKRLDENRIQIGVHIADVSHFVTPGSDYDSRAQMLCTSVYMVHRAYHMLPSSLSSDLCSLVPGKNRFTVSIIMTFDSNFKIMDKWIGRSVINSCAKLSYENAQVMIEGKIEENPPYTIYNGYTVKNLFENINEVFKVTKFLRNERFTIGGALKFDSPELYFDLQENKIPCYIYPHYLKEANNLIEELMLLANNIAAVTIYNAYPKNAVLRTHKSPSQTMPRYLDVLDNHGYKVDPSSAGNFSKSIEEIRNKVNPEIADTVVYFLSKPMLPANYVFTGAQSDNDTEFSSNFHHYGLNINLYTHFTSPIRRYPDILVHRLLMTVVEKVGENNEHLKDYKEICDLSNLRKRQAAYSGADSQRYFLWLYVKNHGKLSCRASFIPNTESGKNAQEEIFLLPYCIALKYTGKKQHITKYKYFNIFDLKIEAIDAKEPYHDMHTRFSFDIS